MRMPESRPQEYMTAYPRIYPSIALTVYPEDVPISLVNHQLQTVAACGCDIPNIITPYATLTYCTHIAPYDDAGKESFVGAYGFLL